MAVRKRRKKKSSKRNTTRRARVSRFAVLGAILLSLFLGGWLLANSGLLALRNVDVYGNKYLSENEVVRLMGVIYGENLLSLPSDEVVGMLSESKWVREVSLRKEYPGRLVVNIEEAVPQALLRMRGETYFVDGEGNVLGKLQHDPVQFLPVIVSDSARNPSSFREAVNLARVLKQKGLATEKKRIEISGVEQGPEELTMNIDGLTAKVGQGDYEEKLRRLFELSDEIRRRHVSVKYVDLRFSNSVIVKPFKEALE